MTTLLGIDCATQPNKTGLALGELCDGVVRISRCAVGSKAHPPAQIALEWLHEREDVLIALDAPLGWPRALGASLHGHLAGNLLSAESNQLFRRATDVDVKNRLGKLPLEVGANFIARTAVAALVLLDDIRRESGRAIPLAWEPNESEPWRAIEVYPAATRLAHAALDKGGSLDGLEGMIDCSDMAPAEFSCDHSIDAAVCVLAAADFLLGRAVPPEDMETARVEGWIWAPPAVGMMSQ